MRIAVIAQKCFLRIRYSLTVERCRVAGGRRNIVYIPSLVHTPSTRLKNDGLLNYEWRESTQGPPRKYYCLTKLGIEALKTMDETWNGLIHTVEVLKSNITDPKFMIQELVREKIFMPLNEEETIKIINSIKVIKKAIEKDEII